MRADALPLGVVLAAEPARVDRGRRLLDRTHVVGGVAPGRDEVGVLELHPAPPRVGRAAKAEPGVLDERPDRLPRVALRAHADHLDARDPAALVARVVALAAAEGLEPRGRPPGGRAGAGGLGHRAAAVLLVAGPRRRLVVVAGGDEAGAEAARPRRRGVEVREREHVLRGAARAVVEGGVEAVAALPTVIPVLDLAVGDRRPPRAGGREVVGPRDPHTPLALLGRHVVAARADDL